MSIDINYELLTDFRRTLSTSFFGALRSTRTLEWPRVARKIPSSSERNVYPFLGELESMREWIGPRITHSLKSNRYELVNRKFELTMTVKRDELLDDLGGAIAVYGDRAAIFADSVARHPDELVMGDALVNGVSRNAYDNQFFFDTDHPMGDSGATQSNIMGGSGDSWYLLDVSKAMKPFIYQEREPPDFQAMTDLSNSHVFNTHEYVFGAHTRDAAGYGLWQMAVKSNQPLDETNFVLARSRMQGFKNDEGRNMRMNPTLLVVPRGPLQAAAEKLFTQDYLSNIINVGTSPATPVVAPQNNFLKNAIDWMVSDYLPFT